MNMSIFGQRLFPSVPSRSSVFSTCELAVRQQRTLFMRLVASIGFIIALLGPCPSVARVVGRTVPTVGSVLTVQGNDNTIRPTESPKELWIVEADQALAKGDHLRTGPVGRLTLLFEDHTQIRVHRDTDLEIRYAGSKPRGHATKYRLNLGAIWGRWSGRVDQSRTTLEMPAATAAIRGTDWYAAVDNRRMTTLVVLAGEVRLYNDQGEILVEAGETATAEYGKPPSKRKTIRLVDKPFMYLDLSMAWIEFLRVNTDSVLRAGGDDPIRRAGLLYDTGRFEEAALLLPREAETDAATGRVLDLNAQLLSGLLAVRAHRFSEADALLSGVAAAGAGRPQQLGELGRFAIAVETESLARAEQILTRLERGPDPIVEVGLARVWFQMLSGNYPAADRRLESLKALQPDEVRVWVLEAQLKSLEGDVDAVDAATERALALAPDDYLAWYWRGAQRFKLEGDEEAALAAYGRALELRPSYGEAWSDRAELLKALGRERQALEAIDRAVVSDPKRALFHANRGTILGAAARRREAEAEFERILSSEPNQPDALRGQSVLRLEEGDTGASIELLRKAEVVDPGNNDTTRLLGIAEYQRGAVSDARKTLLNAARVDPNDPLPFLLLSVIAQDHARADEAIRYAREAATRIERTDPIHVEGIASVQSGVLNVGAAYANLGLDAWGGYYGQRAYSPYSANSQFFLSNTYPSVGAHDSLNLQGLLLDPTAASYNLRYTQFIREPGNEFAFSADGSTTDGGDGWGLDAELHGFTRLPTPLAYRLWGGQAEDDGFRPNSYQDTQRLGGAIGGWFDDANYFFGRAQYSKGKAGLPGAVSVSDPDDQKSNEFFAADLGFQHRIHAWNRFLGRVQWRSVKDHLTNPAARNLGLSDLDFSLINSFGLPITHWLYEQGLYDASSIVPIPGWVSLVFGSEGSLLGLPMLTDKIPPNIDLNPVASDRTTQTLGALQLRHLFEAGGWDLTYGMEAATQEIRDVIDLRDFRRNALGYLTDLGVTGVDTIFLLGSPEIVPFTIELQQHAGLAYIDGTRSIDPDLRIQLGAYLRYLDDDIESDRFRLDPRLGLAWQPADNHWLRAAAQRELITILPDTLAPVTLIGVVPTDDYASFPAYVPGGASHYSTGSSIEDLMLRWDAEWSPHVFTYTQYEQQEIDYYFQAVPWINVWRDNYASFIQLDSVRIRQLQMGANLWVRGGIGFHARYTRNWSRILGSENDAGNRVPLVPDNTLDLGVTFVHPRQVRAAVEVRYLGDRWAETANRVRLEGVWLTDISVNWQPMQHHWSLTAAVRDLFDTEPEVAEDVLAPGRTFLLSAAYRF